MLKRWVAIVFCLILVVSFTACNNDNQTGNSSDTPETSKENTSQTDSVQDETEEPVDNQEEEKVNVTVTFDAMQEFVEAVGKDRVEITTIIPPGAESHGFEPKAQDLEVMSTASVFVYNGLEMESWAEDAISAVDNNDLIIVEASKGADIIERETESDDHDHDHGDDDHDHDDEHDHGDDDHDHEEDDHGHSHGKYDPHLWLSLKEAQTEAMNIKEALVQADPSSKDFYEENYNEFVSQLESLYNEYSEKFKSVERNTFVTGHAAFAYLCRDFDLVQNSIRNIFAEGEPSAAQLAELVDYCRENNITTIFSEEMVSSEVSDTLANEVGAKVEIIYTIESPQDNLTYLERMESNLSKIYDSLLD
jgi:zinc transport system substrate-binding protein